ncbi:hypothetical protein NADFUDRAFT_71133 [Nadsonia fulvescens var. elongata DSM 6958]|uniref:Uncharacterized protein n=1 Tax=Nadsonia fulvescens var. elongata DSM 6958 TaxID=857566 RepID=A0A1E3PH54_9ASCO|nr:hypothetical protein NADFUDRAFT_71133 [Nadsonia fulvescens var. elongata DSM 6958]
MNIFISPSPSSFHLDENTETDRFSMSEFDFDGLDYVQLIDPSLVDLEDPPSYNEAMASSPANCCRSAGMRSTFTTTTTRSTGKRFSLAERLEYIYYTRYLTHARIKLSIGNKLNRVKRCFRKKTAN